jgi:hypothetical protein
MLSALTSGKRSIRASGISVRIGSAPIDAEDKENRSAVKTSMFLMALTSYFTMPHIFGRILSVANSEGKRILPGWA